MKGKKFLAFSLAAALLVGGAMSVSAAGMQDVFDANAYAGKYADLKAAYGNDASALLQHFLANGAKEGRVASDILDVAAYRKAYADLDAAFGDNWDAYADHYLTYGIKEGRTTGVLFDLKDYADKNADVKAAYGEDYAAIASHYVNFGKKEGRKGGEIKKATTTVVVSSGNSGSSNNNTNKPSDNTTVEVPATHEHHWVEVSRKAGTCTEDGYIDYKCDIPKTVQIKDANGNLIRTELVLGADGQPVYCDAVKREVTGKGHVVATNADGTKMNYYCVPATCLAAGVEKYTCARCGEHITNTLPKLEHVFEYSYTVDPHGCTPDLAGYDVYVCKAGCNQTQKRNYTYLDHQVAAYDNKVVPATCTSEGEAWGYCSKCNKEVKQTLPMLTHDNTKTVTVYVDSYTVDKTQPCHTANTLTVCKNCSRIDAVAPGTAVNCVDVRENGGNGDGYCDVCLRSMTRNHTNQVMQYIVGDVLDDKNGQ